MFLSVLSGKFLMAFGEQANCRIYQKPLIKSMGLYVDGYATGLIHH